MKVFVAGATGYIGSAVTKALLRRGHEVIGGARSDAAAAKLGKEGVEPLRVDLANPATLAAGARATDATIQAASSSDAMSSETEPPASHAIVEALAGSGKTFILTSGVWVYGATPGEPATEASKLNPVALTAWRLPVEEEVLTAQGLRGIVIRPGMVYGNGGGLVHLLVGQAKQGNVLLPGGGSNRWAAVHVEDLADLYVLALERKDAAGVFNGTTNETITLKQVGDAVGKSLGVPVSPWPIAEARKALGPFADALATDQVVRSPRSRDVLGWSPHRPSFADDLARASYT